MKLDQNRHAIQALRPVNTETIAFDTSSKQSAVLSHHVVRLVATAACRVSVGENPVASTGCYLPAEAIEYWTVEPGERIAVTQVYGGGDIDITEMA